MMAIDHNSISVNGMTAFVGLDQRRFQANAECDHADERIS
jgi:hypothetical protein